MRFLLASAAGRRLGISGDQVRRLVDEGRLAAVRATGGVRLIDADDVERLARDRGLGAVGAVVDANGERHR